MGSTGVGTFEGLKFGAELATLVSVGYWGYVRSIAALPAILSGFGCALVVAGLWGLLAAPRSPIRLASPVRYAFESTVFATGVLTLVDLGWHSLAVGLALVATTALLGTARRE